MSRDKFPSVSATRIGLLVGVPATLLLLTNPTVLAAVNLKTWNSGDTLTATDLNANFDAVNTETTYLHGTAWTAPTLSNSWTNESGFSPVQYKKMGDMVYLRGMVAVGTSTTTIAFTLPVGFRPPATAQFASKDTKGTGSVDEVDIDAAGNVRFPTSGNDQHFSLEGIVFSVD